MQKVMYSQTKTPICSSKKASRSIPSAPERVLDAPDLQDDYCKVHHIPLCAISFSLERLSFDITGGGD